MSEPKSPSASVTTVRTVIPETGLPIASAALQREANAARAFAEQQHAASTRRAYMSDLATFRAWCAARGLVAIPASPAAVATFIGAQATDGAKPSTITRRLAAIRYTHSIQGHKSPTESELVRATMRGIRRTIGLAKSQKAPATADRILHMVRLAPEGLAGLRDRALLLVGFAGAFRRSELADLQVSDLEFVAAGLRVHIRRSKTDQEGAGQIVAIVRGATACPVASLRVWLDAAGIQEGPVFRPMSRGGRVLQGALTPHGICLIVKAYAAKAGFDPSAFGAHSLRAGFLTSAAMRGASIFKMMDVSRHRRVNTLRGYVRQADEFKDHAGSGLL